MIAFKITAEENSLTTTPIGPLPGGFRLQLGYGTQVRFAGTSSFDAGDKREFDGQVVTGMDWIFLRDDGAAIFDGHLTLQAKNPAHLFDAVISGQADLSRLSPRGADGKPAPWKPIETLADWRKLTTPDGGLAVTLPIAFHTSLEEAALAGRRLSGTLSAAAKNAAMFAELGRAQFLAHGAMHIRAGEIVSMVLDVEPANHQRRS